MKQFYLTLQRNDLSTSKIKSLDKVEGDNLVELLSKFLLVIINLQNTMHNEQLPIDHDDKIPF